ncbi:M15 family metallopeptidase [Azohydromonas caseinilytica]|uniref:M15 family metallopeptidase n=1 Tax=Azohydromonas caseinilytica TaxID=2728836 RepID=A0A848FKL1_9BURK|nr:M15 family metallopeptidase [Azohydromonas caseinilytica]NML18800.1 M15 family metallopeptidase [Azohydromonas caseinilytica]
MLLGVFLYLLLAVPISALLLLAPVRDRAFASTRQWWAQGRATGAGWAQRCKHRARWARSALRAGAGWGGRALHRHAWALGAALCALVLFPLCAWTLRSWMPVDSRGDPVSRAVDERVAALLHGEQLVPPPPLPPAVFMTPEVEQWRPMARHASRQWELLDPAFSQRLLLVFKLMRERHGYDMVLVEGYRSPQRQAALAALGPSVTRAGPYESYHQHGLAADCAFLRAGKVVISERDPWAMKGYALYGEVARSLGLTWGGDWRSLKDYGHVEWRRGNGR